MNGHFSALLGCSPEELLGRSIFDPALAEEIERDQAQFQRQVTGEIDHYTIEKRFRRADGTKLWVSITSSSIHDAGGQFLYAVRVQHNIQIKRALRNCLPAAPKSRRPSLNLLKGCCIRSRSMRFTRWL